MESDRRPNSGPGGEADQLTARVQLAVYEFLKRRREGDPITIEEFAAAYPDLMPELEKALSRGIRQLRQFNEHGRARAVEAEKTTTGSGEKSDRPDHPLRPRPIVPNYRLIREISSGAQGTVFEAIQETTDRTVAVKVVSWVSKNSAARFEREAQSLASLSHPGIVSIIDRGRTADDAYFLVMDFVSGRDLDVWVRTLPCSRQGQVELVETFERLAAAIGVAHEKGIVHRDLKPSNVRVDNLRNARIVDFGLAHLVGERAAHDGRPLTVTGNIVGSIPWASPEQAAGKIAELCPASDVYSLGVLLYHCLTGRFPYAVDGPLHLVTKSICELSPTPLEKTPHPPLGPIDPSLAAIVLQCLAKNPKTRFASGRELAAALRTYLAGGYQPPRPPIKRRYLLLQSVLLILIAAIGLSAYWHNTLPAEPSVVRLPMLTNSIGMEFVQIPAGRFRMGSEPNEQGRQDPEDSHIVRITHPFFLGRTEVTRAEYRRVMGSLPPLAAENADQFPIDQVSWDEANSFCRKLGELDHRHYRLPTDAEWEYACRAGTMTPFSSKASLDEIAWHDANSGNSLHAVALLAQNRWGLFDMHGNVAEWVLDRYVPHLGYAEATDPVHESGDQSHVVRGGCDFDSDQACRSASRTSVPTSLSKPALGFRVVLDDSSTSKSLGTAARNLSQPH